MALFATSLLFEALVWWQSKRLAPETQRLNTLLFWVFALSVIIFGTLTCVSFFKVLALGTSDNFSFPEDHPLATAIILFLLMSSWLACRLRIWRRNRSPAKPSWQAPRRIGLAYLMTIITMAIFRCQMLAEASSFFQ